MRDIQEKEEEYCVKEWRVIVYVISFVLCSAIDSFRWKYLLSKRNYHNARSDLPAIMIGTRCLETDVCSGSTGYHCK